MRLPQQQPLKQLSSYHLWPHRPVSITSEHLPGVSGATAQPPEVNNDEGHRTPPLKNMKNISKLCKLTDQLQASRMTLKKHLPLTLSHKPDEEAADVLAV